MFISNMFTMFKIIYKLVEGSACPFFCAFFSFSAASVSSIVSGSLQSSVSGKRRQSAAPRSGITPKTNGGNHNFI